MQLMWLRIRYAHILLECLIGNYRHYEASIIGFGVLSSAHEAVFGTVKALV